MVYRLRKKFIKICMLSFLAVFVAFLIIFYAVSTSRTNRQVDSLVDILVENNGTFPSYEDLEPLIENTEGETVVTPESPFSTRYFTVRIDSDGSVSETDTSSISRISDKEAETCAARVLKSGKTRGWMDNYRYRKYISLGDTVIIFVDGSVQLTMSYNFLLTATAIFAAGSIVILLLVTILSKYAVLPMAQSYEKQKQFVTDASHELKTPLTLILTNIDIAESELGQNEWLDDVRSEGNQMSDLIRRLITLARMDEEQTRLEFSSFCISDTALECASAFDGLAVEKGIDFSWKITPGLTWTGNEDSIRQLISILLDNALKYCDRAGTVTLSLKAGGFLDGCRLPFPRISKKYPSFFPRKKQSITLDVDNTYKAVDELELNRLFDRFYRSDKARTTGDGFGVGLSIAKSITEKHHGKIQATGLDHNKIRFRVCL